MSPEMKRTRELIDALEPLALAAERFIKGHYKEPRDVYFRLICEGSPGPDMHIPGETVMAAANCWRELKGRLNNE